MNEILTVTFPRFFLNFSSSSLCSSDLIRCDSMSTKFGILIAMILFASGTITGENNNITNSCEPKEEWVSLFIQNKPIRNVCITKDYDYSHPPRKITKVFNVYKSINVINIDEKQRIITVNIKMFSTWEDSRIKVKFSNDEPIILPPYTKTMNYLLVWISLQSGSITNLKEIKHLLDPIVFGWTILHPYIPIDNHLLPPNSFTEKATFVSSEIEWQVTIFCDFEFSYLPFDTQVCKVRFFNSNVNVTMIKAQNDENTSKGASKKTNSANYSVGMASDMNYLNEYSVNGFRMTTKIIDTSLKYTDWGTYRIVESIYGFDIKMKRRLNPYIYQYYLPAITLVIITSLSFIIPLSATPGRVSLVVTQCLTLTNIFINERVRKLFTCFMYFLFFSSLTKL